MKRAFAAGWLLFAIGLSGCGNDLASLKGTVFIDGQPAPEGVSLGFAPLETGGSPAYAATDSEGRYEAAFSFQETGIQPGKHRVHLVPGGGGGSATMPQIGPDGTPVPSASPPALPKEYYQEITTIAVEPGANEIDLQLTSLRKQASG